MSPYLALRRARHLSSATSVAIKPVTISQTKSKLRNVYDPDEALKIYSSFTAANDPSTSPASTRYAQELAVRRLAKSHRFSDIKNFLESHKSLPQITQEPFLSSLIRSYGVVGMFENAINTYNEMTDLGTPRSTLSFNALLSACVQSKVFDRVPVYFYEFPAKFGFSPDKFSYGILIKAYCEMGSPETAMEKLKEMEEKELRLAGLAKKGHMTEAKAMIRTMNKKFPPELLKAWGKIMEELGLAHVDIEEVNSTGIEKVVDSDKIEKAST
ncbi:hypothetical protein DH2020_015856 [Rehmannia glutinosa]|uniref:Pentatricopeptide repeat-containing protein n=1 Tax=Rehmannia glutinosa TaxID=99300 RepID=A0ABR0WUX3_REHGL